MDLIAAIFPDDSAAAAAAQDLEQALELDEDLVTLEHVDATAVDHAGAPVLLAWVPDGQRPQAREVIGSHCGSHVPLDWVQGVVDQVAPESFPTPDDSPLAATSGRPPGEPGPGGPSQRYDVNPAVRCVGPHDQGRGRDHRPPTWTPSPLGTGLQVPPDVVSVVDDDEGGRPG